MDTHRRATLAGVALLSAAAVTLICVLVAHGTGSETSSETAPAAPTGDAARIAELTKAMQTLRLLHTPLGEPRPGDWLDSHDEPGQTFQQYLNCNPTLPQGKRSVIYIQPLGRFTPAQRNVVRQTADFMGRYFGLKVVTRADLPLTIIPAEARRKHPEWGMDQILSTYVLDEVLRPRLPDDAAAYLAFTASDLWPGKGWNFVFGQASLRHRVGVWSIYRNGSLDAGPDERRLCLLRTLKTAVHETGHMFSMLHCTAYECCMCGSNHREEADRRPLWLCPECMAKVCWATRSDPLKRYESLREFCRKAGLDDAEKFYARSIAALRPPKSDDADAPEAATPQASQSPSPVP